MKNKRSFLMIIGREKIKTLTQKATQQYIDENNKLKEGLDNYIGSN